MESRERLAEASPPGGDGGFVGGVALVPIQGDQALAPPGNRRGGARTVPQRRGWPN